MLFYNDKRKNQIKVHKKSAKKTFQYSLRLDKMHYDMLHSMAIRSTMADVIDRAIEVEFEYQKVMNTLFENMPNFRTTNDVDKWVVNLYKSNPELLNKMAKASAIYEYNFTKKKLLKIQQNYLNDLDTVGYLLNKVGVNINQIAKRANNGFDISKDEIASITNQMIKIAESVDLIRQELNQ